MARNKDTAKYVLPSSERPKGRSHLSKYRPLFAEQVYTLRMLGKTDKEIAKVFDVSVDCIIKHWPRRHPEFKHNYDEGGLAADAPVIAGLHKRASGYEYKSEKVFCTKDGDVVRAEITEHVPPDPNAAAKWLGARHPAEWGEKSEVAVGGIPGKPILTDPRPVHDIFIERIERMIRAQGDPFEVLKDPHASKGSRMAAMIEIERRGQPKAIPIEQKTADKGSQEPSA
ncbi:hypothetical protein ACO2I3_01075 [Leptospira interrogans]